VVATLPPYVKWMGATSPSSENITYDPVSGQVTWNIGNVPAYVGSGSDKRSVTFQIGLNAGVDLVGQTPVLVGNSVLTARDDFTGKPLTNTVQGMTTRFSTDPAFVDGNEIIQK
jgi:hypothetical protein